MQQLSERRLRIVALADSLALPRFEGPDVVRWEDTWPYCLGEMLSSLEVEVINCGRRARTVDTLIGEDFNEHVSMKKPELIILQVGIVDCAPRVFSRRERQLLAAAPIPNGVRQWLIKRRGARRAQLNARDSLARVYTAPDRFEHWLYTFSRELAKCPVRPQVIVLPILGAASVLQAKAEAYLRNITLYNSLLESAAASAGWVWVDQLMIESLQSADAYCSDGYHLSTIGHARLAATLRGIVVSHLTSRTASPSSADAPVAAAANQWSGT